MQRTFPSMPILRAAVLALMLALPWTAAAQAPATRLAYATGDAWLDDRLADVDRYAARYPEAFAAEIERYAGASRDYVHGLLAQPGWRAGDAWLACFLARALEASCRSVVRARASAGTGADWSQIVQDMERGPAALARVRLSLADSYRRWARPLNPDPALAKALREREARSEASP